MNTLNFWAVRALTALLISLMQFPLHGQYQIFSIEAESVQPAFEIQAPGRRVMESSDGLIMEYSFKSFSVAEMTVEESSYDIVHIMGFGQTMDEGKPSLPSRVDKILLPSNAIPEIKVSHSGYIEYSGLDILPAQPLPGDGERPESPFIRDADFYRIDEYAPLALAEVSEVQIFKEQPMALLSIRPVQYNPVTKTIRVYKRLKIEVKYNASGNKKADVAMLASSDAGSLISNLVVNIGNLIFEKESTKSTNLNPTGYIIVTTDEFLDAARKLAAWKRQLGFSVKIISRSTWSGSVSAVKTAVKDHYLATVPRPGYLVILGDQEDVPDYYLENIWLTPILQIYSTNYYACMDGENDYIPEMAHGRIPVYSAENAMMVVEKLINYEQNPPDDPTFYRKGIHAGYFEDLQRDGVADKRYAHSTIDMFNYMTVNEFNSDLILYTEPDVNPHSYSSYFSGSTPFPSEYKRDSGYPWDGDKYDILDALNDGRLYAFHRDHGVQRGWVEPELDISDLDALRNGDEAPIVFSINCGSGKFTRPHPDMCFAEKLLRYENGGAIGVVAATEQTRSGYNDAFIMGMVDAIWPNPGLLPDFGYEDEGYTDTDFNPVYRMGDVMIQGLMRMTESYDASGWADRDHFHLYHYFGDPAMEIWTNVPIPARAEHAKVIAPGTTSISYSNTNCINGYATVVYNEEIKAKVRITGNSGTIALPEPLPAEGDQVTLTFFKHDYIPYVAVLGTSNLPLAAFNANQRVTCPGDIVRFHDASFNQPETWYWSISPPEFSFLEGTNAFSQNPVIKVNGDVAYDVSLIVTKGEYADTLSHSKYITPARAPEVPLVSDQSFCDSAVVELVASGSTGTYIWWNSPGKESMLEVGNKYETPILHESQQFFVEALGTLGLYSQSTIFTGTHTTSGNMFDIVASNHLFLDSFMININDNLQHGAEVYYRHGSFSGAENNPEAWILLGNYTVQGQGSDNAAKLSAGGISVAAGDTVGIYITLLDGQMRYTWGGEDFSGEDLSILRGAGIVYPFSTVYAPRTWNGTVFYSKGEFKCNSPLAEVNIEIIKTPLRPEGQHYELCYEDRVPELLAEGNQITWYTDAQHADKVSEGNNFIPENITIGSNHFYATAKAGMCESDAAEFSIIRFDKTPAPIALDAEICQYDTAKIIASGENIRWFSEDDAKAFITNENILTHIGTVAGVFNYGLTNIENGCPSDSLYVAVHVKEEPQIPAVESAEVCQGETVLLVAEGDNIVWFDAISLDTLALGDSLDLGAPPTGDHVFSLTQELNGCSSEYGNVEVVVHSLPELILSMDTSLYLGESIELFGWGEGELIWFDGSTGNSFFFESDQYGLGDHIVSATLTSQFGCYVSDSTLVSVIQKPLITEFTESRSVMIYPNPTGGMLHLDLDIFAGEEVQLIITNTLGNKVYEEVIEPEFNAVERQISLEGLAPGLYILSLSTDTEFYSFNIIRK